MSESSVARRKDRIGQHRTAFDKNRKRILASQDICAICGRVVDKTLSADNPLSAQVDHIIPLAKGGHPSDISNLQLTHKVCNNKKGDKLVPQQAQPTNAEAWTLNWLQYRAQG